MDVVQLLLVGGIYLALFVIWASFGTAKSSLKLSILATTDRAFESQQKKSSPKVGTTSRKKVTPEEDPPFTGKGSGPDLNASSMIQERDARLEPALLRSAMEDSSRSPLHGGGGGLQARKRPNAGAPAEEASRLPDPVDSVKAGPPESWQDDEWVMIEEGD